MFQRNEVSSSSVLDPEDEDIMILQNVTKYSPDNKVSHPRRLDS